MNETVKEYAREFLLKIYDPRLKVFEHKVPRRIVGYIVALFFAFAVAMPVASAFVPDIARGDVFRWCAGFTLLFAVCFYNGVTSAVSMVGAAIFVYWEFRYNGALEWITGDLLGSISAVIMSSDSKLDVTQQVAVCKAIVAVVSFFGYMSAGRLAGAPTMGVLAILAYLLLGRFSGVNFYGYMAIAAAAAATVSALSYGRRRANEEEEALDADYYDAAWHTRTKDSEEDVFEPRVMSGGGASAIAVGAAFYATLAALLAYVLGKMVM